MTKGILAICDRDIDYAYHLMDYLNFQKNCPFEVYAFSSIQTFYTFMEDNTVDLLLINEEQWPDIKVDCSGIYTYLLTVSKPDPTETQNKRLYKYQSSEYILKIIIQDYAEHKQHPGMRTDKSGMKVTGIYSPVGRSGKTSLALTLGQLLARDKPALYINLESFSGFSELLEQQYELDFGDLLYFVRKNDESLQMRLRSMVCTLNELDYIPPIPYPGELAQLAREDWKELLDCLQEHTDYENLILDIGVQTPLELLEYCHKIYLPLGGDVLAAAKVSQFYQMIKMADREYLEEKIEAVNVPKENHFIHPGQLPWGEIGTYTKHILGKHKDI